MRKVLVALAVVAVLAVGGLAYLYFAGGSGEPTTELTTPPITSSTTADTPGTSGIGGGSTASTAGGELGFVISSDESQAGFELDETLRGNPNHVVGTTSEVAGQFRFDPSDPSTMELSQVVVNARTLQTDSSLRDRAIRGPVVLDSASDEFELITFDPTAIEGLPDTLSVGDSASFTVTGDLTIKGTTQPVTFAVDASWPQQDRIEGTATATVDRTAFGIFIPNAPGVADVSDEVTLTFDFVAIGG